MSKKAFSLIELLVVIAVITILISILLPILGKSRYISKDLKCKTQVRSVGQALTNYIVHNAEFFPFPGPIPGTSALTINLDVKDKLDPYLDSDPVIPNIKSQPWFCPLDTERYVAFGSSYYYYAGHYRYLFEIDPPPGYIKMRIMRAYEYFPTLQVYGDVIRNHQGKNNYSLIDGSVRTGN